MKRNCKVLREIRHKMRTNSAQSPQSCGKIINAPYGAFGYLRFFISRKRAKAFFAAMGAFHHAVIIHMNGKSRLPPRRIKFFAAFGTNVFLRRNMLSRQPQGNSHDQHRRNRNHPPRHIISAVKPIHLTRCQGQRDEAKNKNEYANAFFHHYDHSLPSFFILNVINLSKI